MFNTIFNEVTDVHKEPPSPVALLVQPVNFTELPVIKEQSQPVLSKMTLTTRLPELRNEQQVNELTQAKSMLERDIEVLRNANVELSRRLEQVSNEKSELEKKLEESAKINTEFVDFIQKIKRQYPFIM